MAKGSLYEANGWVQAFFYKGVEPMAHFCYNEGVLKTISRAVT